MSLDQVLSQALEVLAQRDTDADYLTKLRPLIEHDGPAELSELAGTGYQLKGSVGLGNAAAVPWIAAFPTEAARSAREGIYAVYLFAEDGSRVWLSLNQAAGQLSGGTPTLRKRAGDIRTAVADNLTAALHTDIDLGTQGNLGRRYEAGNAYAIRYDRDAIPTSGALAVDLKVMLDLLSRVESAGLTFDPEREPTHLIYKWSADREPLTIERHREIAESQGAVWWAKLSERAGAGMGANRLRDLEAQLEAGVPTHVYLYRQGQAWRADLKQITVNRDDVDVDRLPAYINKDECSLFSLIANFQLLDQPLTDLLALASNPDPEGLIGALRNQTNPLFAFELWNPDGKVTSASSTTVSAPVPKLDMAWLVAQTFWPQQRLEEVIESLSDSTPQVVLAGPPGTGKTWVAEAIARFMTADAPLQTRIVQFHPSYGYEEFVEGLRPDLNASGQMVFERIDGEVLDLTAQAVDSDQPHVLIVDEMNRANLPRVFGELMYLLEYRDKPINLMYSQNFQLPTNLHFIGTMNTADRSIRSVDVALRRRFDFFDCPPDPEILGQYYATGHGQQDIPDFIDGFVALNDSLTERLDRHHTIGHTFFMAKQFTPNRLRHVWDRQIAPLIEEYFFDQPDIAAQIQLVNYWPTLAD